MTAERQMQKKPSAIKKVGEYKRAWQRPPTAVAKRNARERTRVHTVNQAFVVLKHHLPSIRSNAKRVSKLKILKAAINYIYALSDMLQDYPSQRISGPTLNFVRDTKLHQNKNLSTSQRSKASNNTVDSTGASLLNSVPSSNDYVNSVRNETFLAIPSCHNVQHIVGTLYNSAPYLPSGCYNPHLRSEMVLGRANMANMQKVDGGASLAYHVCTYVSASVHLCDNFNARTLK
uniref:BHLH domain-containing protein n=1 Tax=Ascaris lumbricoides TaxID=6252 RepID=A0A0M3I6R7_ASCLU